MRVANVRGRLHLVLDGHIIDVSTASRGVFDADPAKAFARWDELRSWAATCPPEPSAPTLAEVDADLGPPSPLARQTFGIGTNYGDHLREVGWTRPEVPLVFTKYPSCIGAPNASVTLVKGHVDWEAEVVVVIGRGGHHIPKERAWNAVAGLTLGQDISERITQRKPEGNPQHSLGNHIPASGRSVRSLCLQTSSMTPTT
jgi:2,4-didehydro-3-deoxy-L-rhamnonate hydrolase